MSNAMTNNQGFTIVETLVAITVLMIAIAGPLVVSSKGLFGADIAKDQMTASYLAQESMEAVKNIRDNGLTSGDSRLASLTGCTISSPCDASALDTPMIVHCVSGACAIGIEASGYGYGHSAATAGIFRRMFYLHSTADTSACVSDQECGVTVEVDWNEGSTPYKILLTSELTSTIR